MTLLKSNYKTHKILGLANRAAEDDKKGLEINDNLPSKMAAIFKISFLGQQSPNVQLSFLNYCCPNQLFILHGNIHNCLFRELKSRESGGNSPN